MCWWMKTVSGKFNQLFSQNGRLTIPDSLDSEGPSFTPDVKEGVRMYCDKMEKPLQRVQRLYKPNSQTGCMYPEARAVEWASVGAALVIGGMTFISKRKLVPLTGISDRLLRTPSSQLVKNTLIKQHRLTAVKKGLKQGAFTYIAAKSLLRKRILLDNTLLTGKCNISLNGRLWSEVRHTLYLARETVCEQTDGQLCLDITKSYKIILSSSMSQGMELYRSQSSISHYTISGGTVGVMSGIICGPSAILRRALYGIGLGMTVGSVTQGVLTALGIRFEDRYYREIKQSLDNKSVEVESKFKSAYEKAGRHDFEIQIPYLNQLGDLYYQRGLLSGAKDWASMLKAHSLYNSCAARAADRESKTKFRRKAYKVQQAYWGGRISLRETQQSAITTKLKEQLKNIRHNVRKDLELIQNSCANFSCDLEELMGEANQKQYDLFEERIRSLSSNCNADMVAFGNSVMSYSEEICGEAPCDFSVLAIGSLARGEATPYSDLEFMFLIDKEKETTIQYFEQLALTSYFLIGNLGETKLRYMAIEELKWFEDISVNGFKIDGLQKHAGNIPTGNGSRKQHNHFISTPEELAEWYDHVLDNPDPKESLRGDLTAMLASTILIYGSEKMHKRLRSRIEARPVNEKRNQASMEMLRNDLNKFNFYPDARLMEKRDVKWDIYRYPSILCLDMKILHQTTANNPFNIIDQLLALNAISETTARCLRFSFCCALYMRLSAYLYHNSQNENISLLSSRAQDVNTREEWYVEKSLFLHMMLHLLPLKAALKGYWLGSKQKLECEIGRSTTVEATALVSYYTLDFERCLEILNFTWPEGRVGVDVNLELIKGKAAIWCSKFDVALNCLTGIFRSYDDPHVSADAHNTLATLYLTQGNLTRALDHCKQGLQFVEDLVNSAEVLQIKTATYLNYGLIYHKQGNYSKALESFQNIEGLQYDRVGVKKSTADMATTYKSIAGVYRSQGIYDKAMEYYSKSHNIYLQLYGDNDHPNLALVLNDISVTHSDQGNYGQAIKLLNNSHQKLQQLFRGQDHALLALCYNNLGYVYGEQGKLGKALEYYKKCLAIRYRLHGKVDHMDIALSIHNIAAVHQKYGHYNESLSLLRTSLQMELRLYGNAANPAIATTLNDIASIYGDKGEYNVALDYYQKCFEMKKQLFGKNADHPGIAVVMDNMANIYSKIGNYSLAMEHYRKSLQMKTNMYGNEYHPAVATAFNNMGNVHHNLGDLSLALEFYTRGLFMMQELCKEEDNPHIYITCENLANLYSDAGDFSRAMEYYNKSWHMKSRFYHNADHPAIALTYNNLATLYTRQGDYRKALEYNVQALHMLRRIYGDINHPLIATSLNNIANIYHKQGNLDQAILLYEKCLDMTLVTQDYDQSPDVARLYSNLGGVYFDQGRHTISLDYEQKSLCMYLQIFSRRDHPSIVSSLKNVAQNEENRGSITTALELYNRALDMNERLYDYKPHPMTATCYNNIAGVLATQKYYDKAHLYYKASLRMQTKLFGENNHPAFTNIYNNIGLILSQQGKYPQAMEYYGKAVETWKRLQGDSDHPKLAATYNNIASLHVEQGDMEAALQLYHTVLEMKCRIYGNVECADIALSYNNLANVYDNLGNKTKALEMYMKSCVMFRNVLGVLEHPTLAVSYNNIAGVLCNMANYSAAREFYTKKLSMLIELHQKSNHLRPELARAFDNLGYVNLQLEDHQAALELYTEALHMQQRLFPDVDNPCVASSLNSVGYAHSGLGNYNLALKYHSKSLEMRLRLYGTTDHMDVVVSYIALAVLYKRTGNHQLSTEYYEKGIQMSDRLVS